MNTSVEYDSSAEKHEFIQQNLDLIETKLMIFKIKYQSTLILNLF